MITTDHKEKPIKNMYTSKQLRYKLLFHTPRLQSSINIQLSLLDTLGRPLQAQSSYRAFHLRNSIR